MPELWSLDYTSALGDNSLLRADDVSAVTKQMAQVASVWITSVISHSRLVPQDGYLSLPRLGSSLVLKGNLDL